jgi:hypothetical protein
MLLLTGPALLLLLLLSAQPLPAQPQLQHAPCLQ